MMRLARFRPDEARRRIMGPTLPPAEVARAVEAAVVAEYPYESLQTRAALAQTRLAALGYDCRPVFVDHCIEWRP